jgi:phenylacetate-CoA ligase
VTFQTDLSRIVQYYQQVEYLPLKQVQELQFNRMQGLVSFAKKYSQFYSLRLPSISGLDDWYKISPLTKIEARDAGRRLGCEADLGPLSDVATGGTTGIPIVLAKCSTDHFVWQTNCIRDELWNREFHNVDLVRLKGAPTSFQRSVADQIRSSEGLLLPDWGRPHNLIFKTGRMGLMDQKLPLDDQIKFILKVQPTYLFTLPSHFRLICKRMQELNKTYRLQAVWTGSEATDDTDIDLIANTFEGARLVTNYSCAEAGYLALQCRHGRLHVCAESVLVEIVDSNNQPCPPGVRGRVLVTPYTSLAAPLIRYELGDEASWGPPCSCGRTLPTIEGLIGRGADYLNTPRGLRRVDLNHRGLAILPAIREFQLIQHSLTSVELRLHISRPLDAYEEEMVGKICFKLGAGDFDVGVSYSDTPLNRTESGKLKMFVQEMM